MVVFCIPTQCSSSSASIGRPSSTSTLTLKLTMNFCLSVNQSSFVEQFYSDRCFINFLHLRVSQHCQGSLLLVSGTMLSFGHQSWTWCEFHCFKYCCNLDSRVVSDFWDSRQNNSYNLWFDTHCNPVYVTCMSMCFTLKHWSLRKITGQIYDDYHCNGR